jgi:hypothetical protein
MAAQVIEVGRGSQATECNVLVMLAVWHEAGDRVGF